MRSRSEKEVRGRQTKPFAKNEQRRTAAPPRNGVAPIYGLSPVLEALRAKTRRIDKIFIADGAREHRLSEIIDLCRERSIPWNKITRDKFVDLVPPDVNHQGVAALIASADYVSVDEIIENAADGEALIVILDGVEDPRNLGAILRVAECAGADGVIIPERRAAGLTETVAKSSAGAIEYIKVAKAANLNRVIDDLKAQNVWVVGTSGDAEMEYDAWDWTQPSALVLGSEGSGLHRLVAENCDILVKIPMYGKIGSVNVSVAAGVILFEVKRQRKFK